MNKIIEVKFGSHLYGTDTPNSDLDLKSIYIPSAKEICLGTYKKTITTSRPKQPFERNTKDDVDIEIFSLDRYLNLLEQSQTVALDFLFVPENMISYRGEHSWVFQEIYNNRFEIINKNVTAFMHYAKAQAAKYGLKGFRVHALRTALEWLKSQTNFIKLEECEVKKFITNSNNEHIKLTDCKSPNGSIYPHLEVCGKKYPLHATVKYVQEQIQRRFDEYGARALSAEKNENVDWKALSHSVRVNSEAKELLETGNITFPLPNREFILKIKKGELPYKEVAEIIENGLEELETIKEKSFLRETSNREWIDNFIYEIYSDIIKSEDYK